MLAQSQATPKTGRFAGQDRLLEQVASPENLLSAWRAVRGNIPRYRRVRSAGPDGVNLEEFERDLSAQLSALRHMLLKGSYQPQPPGLFSLPKPDGGERKIALLNVSDRVAQRAAQQVIEPLWEGEFLPCSYGFRPGRSTYDAIACARSLRGHGYRWVVDGDIAACFDSLDHQVLLDRISKRLKDGRVLELVKLWLDVGIVEHGLPAEKEESWLGEALGKTTSGVKQGIKYTVEALFQQPDSYQRYAPYSRWDKPETGDDLDDDRRPSEEEPGCPAQQKAFRQAVFGALALAAGYARPAIVKWGSAALTTLQTPAGRLLLKKGILAAGGVGGACLGAGLAAYFVYRRAAHAQVGVLQGSPLSPLLANIYLHAFDAPMLRAGHRLVRFADDWVVLCPTEETAEAAYNQAVIVLDRIHLKVNPQKTRILSPADPLNWLGESIQ